jgi:hypothetical protein
VFLKQSTKSPFFCLFKTGNFKAHLLTHIGLFYGPCFDMKRADRGAQVNTLLILKGVMIVSIRDEIPMQLSHDALKSVWPGLLK